MLININKMQVLKTIFPENCFINDTIIGEKLFETENYDRIKGFLKRHDNDLTKIFIDSIDNLECIDNDGWRLINYICCFSTSEIIKYIIEKGIYLECETNWLSRPIHYICAKSNLNMIKYFVDYGKLPIDNIKNERMKGYVKAHMMYQLQDSEELMMQHLRDKNKLYQEGFKMAINKLFGKCIKSARK